MTKSFIHKITVYSFLDFKVCVKVYDFRDFFWILLFFLQGCERFWFFFLGWIIDIISCHPVVPCLHFISSVGFILCLYIGACLLWCLILHLMAIRSSSREIFWYPCLFWCFRETANAKPVLISLRVTTDQLHLE